MASETPKNEAAKYGAGKKPPTEGSYKNPDYKGTDANSEKKSWNPPCKPGKEGKYGGKGDRP